MTAATLAVRNTRLMLVCAGTALAMVAAAFAAVPLYDLFCRVTGFGGTPRIASAEAGTVLTREMRVRFDASRASGLPVRFEPVDRSATVQVGETTLAFYRLVNESSRPLTLVATYNVMPERAALYFAKLECFCFIDQTLQPGEEVELPVLFFIDPLIAEDARMDDVAGFTLSYTFFESHTREGAAAVAAARG
ncbi:MAG: cytochrome c oxidase assembly protein [Maricaulaceae bacterium]|nr:cytochrome c oxidase assembly protein [Maricaulaceae bacterium]